MQPQYITLPPNAPDISGQRFGKLVALGPIAQVKFGIKWLCQCDCGNTSTPMAQHLLRGNTKSCGCSKYAKGRNQTHGMSGTRIYKAWAAMIERCESPAHNRYANYGGRGIQVCDEWRNSFEVFYAYVSQLPNFGHKGYSLDRINNDGNYEPGNVHYATYTEQARNTRQTTMLTLDGVTKPLTAWAEELGMNVMTLHDRLERGWSVERTLTTPVITTFKRRE